MMTSMSSTANAVESLRQLLVTGRCLRMVTGRELPHLLSILPEIDLCEWIVAENGDAPQLRQPLGLAEGRL